MKFKIIRKNINESNTADNLAVTDSPDIEAMDYVIFKGQRMQVTAKTAEHMLILLSPEGFTIECSPDAVKLADEKKNNMPPEFKFDKQTSKILDEKILPCKVCYNGWDVMNEKLYVKFGEWFKAPTDQTLVHIVNEDERLYTVPKENIFVQQLPTSQDATEEESIPQSQQLQDAEISADNTEEDKSPGKEWQYGVEISKDGQPLRKLLINSISYTSSKNDTDGISVLFFTENGYKAGIVPKELLSPILAK